MIFKNFHIWIIFLFTLPLLFIYTIQLDEKNKFLRDDFYLVLIVYIVSVIYYMNCYLYLLTPTMEREYGLRYILNLMSCKSATYWIGTFLMDYLVYILTIFLLWILIFAYSWIELYHIGIDISLITFTYLIGIGISLITFAYLFSFTFKNSNRILQTFPLAIFFVFCIFICYLLNYLFIE